MRLQTLSVDKKGLAKRRSLSPFLQIPSHELAGYVQTHACVCTHCVCVCIYIFRTALCRQNAPSWAKVRKLFRSSREPCCSPRGVHSTFKLNCFRIWPTVPFSNQDALPSLSGSAFANSHSPKGGDDDQKGHCWLRRALLCRELPHHLPG